MIRKIVKKVTREEGDGVFLIILIWVSQDPDFILDQIFGFPFLNLACTYNT